MRKTLLVTNDFPPRAGGIQTFLEGFVGQLDPQQLIVYASTPPDGPEAARHYDEQQPYTVVRYPGTTMLPTPHVSRTMVDLIRAHGVKNVWFGAAAPLGLMAHAAHKAGAEKVIATTHGHEIGWSMIPGARHMLRKVFADADVVTYLTHATLRRLSPFIGSTPIMQLHGAIDPELFAFDRQARAELRRRYGIGQHVPVVVCISRLVPRKGQDVLIKVGTTSSANIPERNSSLLEKVHTKPNYENSQATPLRNKTSSSQEKYPTANSPPTIR